MSVLKKRLGKLSNFILFFLNNNNDKYNKKEFYENLKEFVLKIEEFEISLEEKNLINSKIIENDEIKFLNLIKKNKKEKKYDDILKILYIFKDKLSLNIYNKFKKLDFNLKYPNNETDFFKFMENLIKLNEIKKIKKEYLFQDYPDDFIENAKKVFCLQKKEFENLDLNSLIFIKKNLNNSDFKKIFEIINHINPKIFIDLYGLNKNLIYINNIEKRNYLEFKNELAKINKIKKKNYLFIKKYPKKFENDSLKNFELLKNFNNKKIDVNTLIKKVNLVNRKIYEYIYQNKENLNYEVYKKIDEINNNLQYFYGFKLGNFSEFIEKLAEVNKIEKINKKYFKKEYPDQFIKNSEIILNLLKIDEIKNNDFNEIVKLINKINWKEINEIISHNKELKINKIQKTNENDLIESLIFNLRNKIERWKKENKENYLDYKRFSNAVKKGRRIPFKFLDDHKFILEELFPIQISTPELLNINLNKKTDYIIMDESSQIFIEIGLPILYLGKIKILSGDDKQMKPTSWFITRDEEEKDDDIAEDTDSILNYALEKGIYKIMLNQNYRSKKASLMSFFSKNFYDSKLEVINQNDQNKGKSIIVKNVNGIWEKSINQIEANEIINILLEEINNHESIIILTFNKIQKQLIMQLIINNHKNLYNLMESEKISIRNIENVQGDEASLVIASVVYDPSTMIRSTYVAREGGANALNVAVSRAINKLIVVKSIYSNNLNTEKILSKDYLIFQKWLDFLDMDEKEQTNYSINNKILESYGEVESLFERDVINKIKDKIFLKNEEKLKIIKQYEVGSKRIDIAFVNELGDFVLGIEVDGYNYHEGKGIDKYLEDISRQEFLEAKGYSIFRIRELDWKINKNKVLNDLQVILDLKINNNQKILNFN